MNTLNRDLYHKYKEIRQKKEINPALHVMECPVCGKHVASASERKYLPQYTSCSGPGKLLTKSEVDLLDNEDKIWYNENVEMYMFETKTKRF